MFERNIAYEASAGSGKTFMLVVRYLGLLFLDASPAKILALTFTNKAASEMQERIIATLEELHTPKRSSELKKGCGIFHNGNVIHRVESITTGTRWSLIVFFFDEDSEWSKDENKVIF
jgi:superfamily I DNA/RNA helicase